MNYSQLQPNILFILTDQQRWDALSTVNPFYKTPNLEKLANSGISYDNCYVNAPACVPSRLSLATGLYPHNLGVTVNKAHDLNPYLDTWMKRVRNNGYYTCLIGKSHLHRHKGDVRSRLSLVQHYGFDYVDEICGPHASVNCGSNLSDFWKEKGVFLDYIRDMSERKKCQFPPSRPLPFDKDLYPDSYVKDSFCNFVNNYQHEKPWCAFLGFSGPHEPWDAPLEFLNMYDLNLLDHPRSIKSGRLGFVRSSINNRLKKAENNIKKGMDYLSLRLDYAASVSFIDDLIGEIISCLAINNVYKDTLIIFSSDHGEMNGDYGLLHKQCFFDGAVRVPLLIKPPRTDLFQGVNSNSLVSLMDVASTIIEYSDAQNNNSDIGFSNSLKSDIDFYVSTDGTEAICESSREYLVSHYGNELMLLDSRFKFMLNKNFKCYAAFDKINDPLEQTNLLSDRGKLPEFSKTSLQLLKEKALQLILQTQNFSNGHFCD